jgi:phosphoglycolate phosphatase
MTKTLSQRPAVRLQTLVFDLDGTLVDSLHDIVLSFQYAFRVLGLSVPDYAAVRAQIGRPLETMFAAFNDSQIAALTAIYCAYYPKHAADHAAQQPGVPEALEALRWRGYKLAVATTKRTPVAEALLRAVGLDSAVDVIQGTDGFAHKPAPGVIYRALAHAGGRGSWMVGDTVSDIQAGQAAGLQTYAVTWGTQDAATLRGALPTVVAPTLEVLLELT